MKSISEYDYKELEAAVLTDPTEENVAALGEWFEQYGTSFWNGECWTVNKDYCLYPINEPDEVDEDGEVLTWKIVGYELR